MENITDYNYIRLVVSRDQHFSMATIKENNLDLDKGNEMICGACSLPIFSTPFSSQSCRERESDIDDVFFHMNGCCAPDQISRVLTDHSLHPNHPLELHDDHELIGDDDLRRCNIICDNCRMQCRRGFFYQCPNQNCGCTLDLRCAVTVKVVHRSHKHHLSFIPKGGNSFTCGACGLEGKADFYWCHYCNFFLHPHCATLPNTILLTGHHADIGARLQQQQHPLTLTFDLPKDSFKFMKSHSSCCSICKHRLSRGVYFCTRCDFSAHIKCAIFSKSSSRNFSSVSSEETASGLPHLPMKDGESLINYLTEKRCIIINSNSGGGGGAISSSITDTMEEVKKRLHDHHELMIFSDENDENHEKYTICNACVDPIIIIKTDPLIYNCCSTSSSSDDQCNTTTTNPNNFYIIHQSCAHLPLNLNHPLHRYRSHNYCKDDPLVLLPTSTMFKCHCGCSMYSNGFVYSCEKSCGLKLDVKCAVLPDAITYELHGNSHILFLSSTSASYGLFCNCCGRPVYQVLFYRCSSCPNFTIHSRCALLPSSVLHNYDRHPLTLTPFVDDDESSTDDLNGIGSDDIDFCEICEESINPPNSIWWKSWFYHCKKCITSFHIDCIPSAGWGSKIRFGGTTIRVQCHDCPLTCIRLLLSYSYTCGHCQKIIPGKEEATIWGNPVGPTVAFECTKCGYWLHYECAQEEIGFDMD